MSIADADHMVEADYFGVETGNKAPDIFGRSGLTASKAENVDAPVINEFPICLEYKFIEYQSNEYGCAVISKVVNVTADESVMVDGRIDMSLVNAIWVNMNMAAIDVPRTITYTPKKRFILSIPCIMPIIVCGLCDRP